MKFLQQHCFKIIAVCLFAIGLSGCGPIYQTTYSYKAPRTTQGRYCANACLSQKSQCQMRCQEDNQICHQRAKGQAFREYRQWARMRRRQKLPVDRNVDWFADYSQCTDSCGCQNDYNTCFSNCGGQVIPHTRCVAFCDKAKPGTVPPKG